MLLREPDLLVWLAQTADQLNIEPPRIDDLQRTDNKEIFQTLKTHMTSDEAWDLSGSRCTGCIAAPQIGQTGGLSRPVGPRSDGELHEGLIKDIVHLRLQRLKAREHRHQSVGGRSATQRRS